MMEKTINFCIYLLIAMDIMGKCSSSLSRRELNIKNNILFPFTYDYLICVFIVCFGILLSLSSCSFPCSIVRVNCLNYYFLSYVYRFIHGFWVRILTNTMKIHSSVNHHIPLRCNNYFIYLHWINTWKCKCFWCDLTRIIEGK